MPTCKPITYYKIAITTEENSEPLFFHESIFTDKIEAIQCLVNIVQKNLADNIKTLCYSVEQIYE